MWQAVSTRGAMAQDGGGRGTRGCSSQLSSARRLISDHSLEGGAAINPLGCAKLHDRQADDREEDCVDEGHVAGLRL